MHTTPGTGVLPCTRRLPQSRAVFPQLPGRGSPLSGPAASTGHGGGRIAGRVPSTAHAVVPTPGLCALNRGQRRPHSRAVHPQTHMEVSPLEGRGPQLGMEGSRHALRAPWKTHRRVPTRGPTSSPAHGGLPTHGPCAFNRPRSGSHSQTVRPQAHREGSHSRATHHQPHMDGSSRL